jgi:hypothetical protein
VYVKCGRRFFFFAVLASSISSFSTLIVSGDCGVVGE